jgi:AraC-like DNA-binding protein
MDASSVRPRNRVKAWRDKVLPDTQFLRAEYLMHRFPPHVHDEFAIGFIERGAQAAVMREHSLHVLMPAGTICVINPGQFHEGSQFSEIGWDYRMIYISPDDLGTLLSADVRAPLHFPEHVIDDPETLLAIRMAHLSAESGDASLLEQSSRLTFALNQLVSRHAMKGRSQRQMLAMPGGVKRARDYIDAHIGSNPTLQEIADVAGLSPFHLLREFKRVIGLAPHAYLMQRRVEHAKRLLLSGRPLRTIAIDLGYADQSHLSREIRRFLGVPPSALHP